MSLRLRKKVVFLMLLGIVSMGVFGIQANADKIVKKGIREYNGIFTDEAFSWTGSDRSGFVAAGVVNSSTGKIIVNTTDNDGWSQTPQVSYKSAIVYGIHAAGKGSSATNGTSYP